MVKKKATSKARQLTRIVSHPAITKLTGQPLKPVLAGQMKGVLTFIGHLVPSSRWVSQRNIVVDPNSRPRSFSPQTAAQPRHADAGDLLPIDFLLVTHAHFDHLHRPLPAQDANLTRKLRGHAPVVIRARAGVSGTGG